MTFMDHVNGVLLVLWRIAGAFWIAFLTWRYLRFGPTEFGLLFSFSLMVSAAMIARAIGGNRVNRTKGRRRTDR